MNNEQFEKLCATFGFAPSRSLRELLDAAVAQACLREREACAKVCEIEKCSACAADIRARGV